MKFENSGKLKHFKRIIFKVGITKSTFTLLKNLFSQNFNYYFEKNVKTFETS